MTPLTDRELAEIEERWQAAAPSPWVWSGNTTGKSIELISAGTRMGDTVLGFRRWGMQRAQPVFCVDGLLSPGTKHFIHPQPHNAWLVRGINHPDAIAIEHAPADVAALLSHIKVLETIIELSREAVPS